MTHTTTIDSCNCPVVAAWTSQGVKMKQHMKNDQRQIRKLFPDYTVEFGDGGMADLDFPVYSQGQLNHANEEVIRQRLARQLRGVDKLRNDVQPNGVVHDIIDPTLHANILSHEQISNEIATLDKRNKQSLRSCNYYDLDDVDAGGEAAKGENEYEQIKEKRGRFQWVPAVVRCSFTPSLQKSGTTSPAASSAQQQNAGDNSNLSRGHWSACFQSPIAGVPERQYSPQFYQDIETVFSSMLPMFRKLGVLKDQDGDECDYQDLQVITKVQQYVIPQNSEYTGRWHTEGFTERIVAAGVYYIDAGRPDCGGNLIFRPPTTPDYGWCKNGDGFRLRSAQTSKPLKRSSARTSKPTELPFGSERGDEIAKSKFTKKKKKRKDDVIIPPDPLEVNFRRYTKKLQVFTGTAVAFSNDIPHRFDTIKGSQRRLFVNFFIVDPKAGLPTTTANTASYAVVRRLLLRKGLEDSNLCENVCEFCGGYSKGDLVHRTVVRDQARAAMSAGRQHWKSINYGNAGYLMFFPDSRWRSDVWDTSTIGGRQGKNYEHSAKSSDLGSGL